MADHFRLSVRLVPATLLILAIPAAMAAAQTPAERAPPLPPGQVWQCVHDGHKIFSDAPCGSGATIRQLNDVNVMHSSPPTHALEYLPGVANAPYAAHPEDEAAEEAADGSPVYVTQAVGIAARWQRVRHVPRPLHRARPAARPAAAHAAAR